MKNNRTEAVKKICTDNVETGCRTTCPLAYACKHYAGDTKEIFDKRMNEAAEKMVSDDS